MKKKKLKIENENKMKSKTKSLREWKTQKIQSNKHFAHNEDPTRDNGKNVSEKE